MSALHTDAEHPFKVMPREDAESTFALYALSCGPMYLKPHLLLYSDFCIHFFSQSILSPWEIPYRSANPAFTSTTYWQSADDA